MKKTTALIAALFHVGIAASSALGQSSPTNAPEKTRWYTVMERGGSCEDGGLLEYLEWVKHLGLKHEIVNWADKAGVVQQMELTVDFGQGHVGYNHWYRDKAVCEQVVREENRKKQESLDKYR